MACQTSSSPADCSEHLLEVDIIQSLAAGVAISCSSQHITNTAATSALVTSDDVQLDSLVCIDDDDGVGGITCGSSDGPSLLKCVPHSPVGADVDSDTSLLVEKVQETVLGKMIWEEDRM